MSVTVMTMLTPGADDRRPPSTRVVELDDGRLGFAASSARCPHEGSVVTLTAADRRVTGVVLVLRSGRRYEEVRSRLRSDADRWERWRLRRDRPVVLVTPNDG